MDAGRHVDVEVGRSGHQSQPGRSVAPPRLAVTGLAVRGVDISTHRQRALVRRYRIANVDHVERYAGALFGGVHIAAAGEDHHAGYHQRRLTLERAATTRLGYGPHDGDPGDQHACPDQRVRQADDRRGQQRVSAAGGGSWLRRAARASDHEADGRARVILASAPHEQFGLPGACL